MRLLRGTILLLTLAAWLAGAGAVAADAEMFSDRSLGDFPAELKAAQEAGKAGVMLMFEIEGCPYCRKMKQQVLSRDEVQEYFHEHFAIFSVDARGDFPITDFSGRDTTEKDYARALKIRGMPSFVIFGVDGRELARFAGVAKDAEEFMRLGRYVADGHYQTQSIEQYQIVTQSGKN